MPDDRALDPKVIKISSRDIIIIYLTNFLIGTHLGFRSLHIRQIPDHLKSIFYDYSTDFLDPAKI